MAGNTYLTIDMITAEAVMLFKNSNLFIMNMDTQYDDQFAIDGAKIGDTLRIRLPSDFVVNDGPAMQLQDNTQQFTTLTVSSQKNVATPYTTAERTMSIDRYSELVMAPMVNALCGKVASTIMKGSEGGVCNLTANFDGAGNIITPTSDQFLDANAILDDQGADDMDRRVVNSPKTDARTTTALQGLFNPTPEISAQFRSGKMKSGLGYARWFRDQTVISHTTGTFSAGGTVNGGGQTTGTGGGNITVNAITGTIKKGDIFTFAGVNAVNRVTKDTLGTLRQFVATADVATGGTVIPIYPGLIPSATGVAGGPDVQYQTVDASPLNGAAMVLATPASSVYRKSIAYTQKAVTMATADLVMPKKAVEEAARTNYDGISMRILTDYLPNTDQLATRVDVLFGFRYIRPEWLCVVADKV
jgi:hypothetical protein